MADDLVYENVGYTDNARSHSHREGNAPIRFAEVNWDVKIHRIASDGATVLTERIDAVIAGPFTAYFWVCGVFEVHDGRITLWRDYFDVMDLIKGMIRGLIAIAIPSLRRY